MTCRLQDPNVSQPMLVDFHEIFIDDIEDCFVHYQASSVFLVEACDVMQAISFSSTCLAVACPIRYVGRCWTQTLLCFKEKYLLLVIQANNDGCYWFSILKFPDISLTFPYKIVLSQTPYIKVMRDREKQLQHMSILF